MRKRRFPLQATRRGGERIPERIPEGKREGQRISGDVLELRESGGTRQRNAGDLLSRR